MAQSSIGRFRIKSKLGAGNQGTVYCCLDPELQRQVAVKLLDKALLGSQEAAAAFQGEARSMSRIQHPNIVTIYESGRHAGAPFLVCEYVQGQLLSERIGQGIEPAQALSLFHGMLAGMARAHSQGIVHRDLKPANIIISDDGVPKIMDFGIARILTGRGGRDSQLIGTPRYMAPEYIDSGRFDVQTDVFALGLIFAEMLTGAPVFQGKTQQAVLNAIANSKPAPPSSLNGELDEGLDRLVLKALEKDPKARFVDAGEFLRALEEYQESHGPVETESAAGRGTIEFLLRRMQRKSDFPALSTSIRNINAMADSNEQDIRKMAEVIVKDFALTNKILQVVNSAYFGHFSGKIGTVSRAVVVLGMQPIRSLAASLIFFEHLSDKDQASELRAMTASALYSAVVAGKLTADLDPDNREEYFLSAMLQSLGAVLVAYYLDEEAAEIRRLQAQKALSAEQAQRHVLGVSFEEVGQAIAGHWNFPADIKRSLKPIPPDAEIKPAQDLDERRRQVASFANETALWLGGQNQSSDAERRLLKRFGKALELDAKKFQRLLTSATQEFLKLTSQASAALKDDPFMRRLKSRMNPKAAKASGAAASGGAEAAEAASAGQLPDSGQVQQDDAEALLMEGLQEVTNLLLNQTPLAQLCNVVLESMYRSMNFQRVILCFKDRSGSQMEFKTGFGDDLEAFRRGFRFPLAWQADVFHACLRNSVDVYIADIADAKIAKDLPGWFRRFDDVGSFLLFPLSVNKRTLGLIYADHPAADGLNMTPKTLNLLKSLRNQIVLGLRERI